MNQAWKNVRDWITALWLALREHDFLVRASSLTYITSLALVPFLAMIFAILKGVGLQRSGYIQRLLMQMTGENRIIVENVIEYINRTNVTSLGMAGFMFVLVSIFTLISNMEDSFNLVWGVRQGRRLSRKLTDYLSLVLVCPVLLIASFSVTATLESSALVNQAFGYLAFSPLQSFFLKFLLPFLPVFLALVILYKFMPNTRVPLRSALLGAAVTGSILQTSQWVFIKNQIGTANYNIIYGSFAQIPLFLIWIYLSWLIVLIGAQVSFMVRSWRPRHGVRTWAAPDCLTVVAGSLAVLAHLVQATREEKSPVSVMELSRLLDVPIDFVQHRMFELERAGLVVEVGKGARTGFVPNFLPSEKQLTQVAMLLAGGQKDSSKSGLGDVLTFFRELFGPAWTDFEHSEANMTMDVFSTNFCSRSEKLK